MKRKTLPITMKHINPFKPIRIRKVHFNLDTDRDAIPDFRDCRPFDYWKQHIHKSTRERVNQLEISVVGERGELKGETIEITSPLAKKYAPQATAQIYSVMQEFPHLLGEVERAQAKNPDLVLIHTYQPWEMMGGHHFGTQSGDAIISRSNYQGYKERGVEHPYKNARALLAETIFHELVHVRQQQRDPKFQQKYQSFARKHSPPMSMYKDEPEEKQYARYRMNPYEAEAYREGEEKTRERYTWPSEEERNAGFRRIIK